MWLPSSDDTLQLQKPFRAPIYPTPTHLTLTQGVRLAVLIRNCEYAHHFMALLAEVCVHFLSKQALANQGQLQLILVVSLCERVFKY